MSNKRLAKKGDIVVRIGNDRDDHPIGRMYHVLKDSTNGSVRYKEPSWSMESAHWRFATPEERVWFRQELGKGKDVVIVKDKPKFVKDAYYIRTRSLSNAARKGQYEGDMMKCLRNDAHECYYYAGFSSIHFRPITDDEIKQESLPLDENTSIAAFKLFDQVKLVGGLYPALYKNRVFSIIKIENGNITKYDLKTETGQRIENVFEKNLALASRNEILHEARKRFVKGCTYSDPRDNKKFTIVDDVRFMGAANTKRNGLEIDYISEPFSDSPMVFYSFRLPHNDPWLYCKKIALIDNNTEPNYPKFKVNDSVIVSGMLEYGSSKKFNVIKGFTSANGEYTYQVLNSWRDGMGTISKSVVHDVSERNLRLATLPEILEEAQKRYPVGTYVSAGGGVYELTTPLQWYGVDRKTISANLFPIVFDMNSGWTYTSLAKIVDSQQHGRYSMPTFTTDPISGVGLSIDTTYGTSTDYTIEEVKKDKHLYIAPDKPVTERITAKSKKRRLKL